MKVVNLEWCDKETLGSWEDFTLRMEVLGDYVYGTWRHPHHNDEGEFQDPIMSEFAIPNDPTLIPQIIKGLQVLYEGV